MTGLAQTKKAKTSPKIKASAPLFQSGTVPLVLLDANILIPEYLRARVLQDLLSIYPAELPVVLKAMCQRFKKPPITQEDLLGILENSQCKGFAAKLATAWGFMPAV